MYKKINFKDWEDNKPDTYLVDSKPTKIIKDKSGVTQEGTLLNAETLNHLEDGIYNNSVDINNSNLSIYNLEKNIGNVEELVVGENLVDSINKVFTSASSNKEQLKSIVTGLELPEPPPPNATMEDLLNILHNYISKDIKIYANNVQFNMQNNSFVAKLPFEPDIILFFTNETFADRIILYYYFVKEISSTVAYNPHTSNANAKINIDYNNSIKITPGQSDVVKKLGFIAFKTNINIEKLLKEI